MTETTTGNKKWYVIRAISGKEKKVKQYIESEIVRTGLQDYVSQVLIPMEKFYQIKDGKKVVAFPMVGYWLDIGKHEDYTKAAFDIKNIKF